MLEALLSGALAGYGIAIPVGAIAVLIVGTAIRCGFWCGASAGAGAATADFLYASLAVLAGAATARLLEPYAAPIRVVSGSLLLAIAASGLWSVRKSPAATVEAGVRKELAATYARFVGLTIVNPLTVIYFTTLVVGSGLGSGLTPAQGAAFAAAAFVASLSWQTVLAAVGALARHRLSARFRVYSVVGGNLIVAALAVRVLLSR